MASILPDLYCTISGSDLLACLPYVARVEIETPLGNVPMVKGAIRSRLASRRRIDGSEYFPCEYEITYRIREDILVIHISH